MPINLHKFVSQELKTLSSSLFLYLNDKYATFTLSEMFKEEIVAFDRIALRAQHTHC